MAADPARQATYGTLLADLHHTYDQEHDYVLARAYTSEAALGVELLRFANSFATLQEMIAAKAPLADIQAAATKARPGIGNFFKNYNAPTDRRSGGRVLLRIYAENTPPALLPEYVKTLKTQKQSADDWNRFAVELFTKSRLTSAAAADKVYWTNWLQRQCHWPGSRPRLCKFASAVRTTLNTQIQPPYQTLADNVTLLQRSYLVPPCGSGKPAANSTPMPTLRCG